MFLRTKEVKLFSLVLNWNGNPILTFNFILGDEVNIFDRGFSYFIFICTFRDCITSISYVSDNFTERTILIFNITLFLVWIMFPTKAIETCLTYDIWIDSTHYDWIPKITILFDWLRREASCISDPSFLGRREIVPVISEQFLHDFFRKPLISI